MSLGQETCGKNVLGFFVPSPLRVPVLQSVLYLLLSGALTLGHGGVDRIAT